MSNILIQLLKTLVDLDLFSDIRRIEVALTQHDCTEALTWCNENKAALRKIKVRVATTARVIHAEYTTLNFQNNLEFDLRFQEYIELCRAGRREEAIAYSKKHLVSWQDSHLSQIKQASGLLAFPANTSCAPYKVSGPDILSGFSKD